MSPTIAPPKTRHGRQQGKLVVLHRRDSSDVRLPRRVFVLPQLGNHTVGLKPPPFLGGTYGEGLYGGDEYGA